MVNRAIEFVSFLDALGVALVITLIPFFTKELGVGAFGFGAITSLYGFCQIIGGSIIGYLSNGILSRKMILLISSIGSGVSYALLLIRGSITSLVVSRVLIGLIKQSTTSCKVCFSRCLRNRHLLWWAKMITVRSAFPSLRPFATWVPLCVLWVCSSSLDWISSSFAYHFPFPSRVRDFAVCRPLCHRVDGDYLVYRFGWRFFFCWFIHIGSEFQF